MTTAVQRRRGTNTEHSSFTGLEGEISVNTTNESVHVHDGSTAGGFEMMRADGSNSGSISSDLLFNDNVKAIFGAGSDLQIYHDGSTNKIVGSIDVTGTVTSDGLTVDTNTLHVDATNNRVGIGTSSPTESLAIHSSANAQIRLQPSATGTSGFINTTSGSTKGMVQYNHNSDYMRIYTNGSERMRIDSSGNVGIGTSSPSYPLDVDGLIAARDAYLITANSSGTPSAGAFMFRPASNTLALGTNSTERLRIDSSGNVLVGKTSNSIDTVGGLIRANGQISGCADGTYAGAFNRKTSDGDIVLFRKDGSTVGSISVSSSATSFNTSSDQRLKENIADADDAGSKIDAIQVRKYDWKADGSHQDYGMIAQELQTVAPEAVSGDADSEEMMGVDYSKLVPMLIKEIQTLRNRVAQLENN